MKLAIRGHDLGKKGEFDLTERLCDFDLDGLQLVPYKVYPDISYSPEISLDRAKLVADSINAAGKSVYLLGAYFNPVHSDTEKVKNGIATFKRYLELSNVFGCKVVGSETGSFNNDKWTYNPLNRTNEALSTVISVFSDLADYAKKTSSVLAMEGAAGHVCFSVARLNEALAAIGDDSVRVIFDIYNYLDDENHSDYKRIVLNGLKTFDGRIHCFHMKDYTLADGKIKQCAIGKGLIDYKWYLKQLKAYDEDAILVLEGTTGEDIAPSIRLIRDLWAEI